MAVGGVGIIVLAVLFHGGGTSPEPTVAQFLLDWESGQYQQAAALTTGQPSVVASELRDAYTQLDASDITLGMQSVSQQGSSATAGFAASIDLENLGLRWGYHGQFGLREYGQTWRVIWNPSVIVPGLQAGDRLALVLPPGGRQQIEASAGQPLTAPSRTYEIGVNPIPRMLRGTEVVTLANRLTQALDLPAAVATELTDQIGAAPPGFQELFTLDPAQYAAVASKLNGIRGLIVRRVTQRLFDSIAPYVVGEVGTETAKVLQQEGVAYRPGTTIGLSGLQQAYQSQLTGTPSTEVIVENREGEAQSVLKGAYWPGVKGKPVVTTIDYGMQQAADAAVGQVPGSAAVVAVDAPTGKILAVASGRGAGMPELDPLSGAYEPGQAFTMISSAMFLADGMTPDSPLPCDAANPVDGHTFSNIPPEPHMKQGTKFSTDFAVGCSTAFAGASLRITGSELMTAADEFGIGARYQLPLDGGFSGTLGPAGTAGQTFSEAGLAAATIGRGEVQVSPLAMALAAGVAESGRWSAPSLVTGQPDPKAAVRAAMSPQVLTELQGLMRDEVAHGSGALAKAGSGLYGQAGVAPFADGHKKLYISWFVGYQGTTAFAVAELVKSPSDSAAPLAGSFLRNIQAGY
jgi:cell division protein FtsI/penicillin-binding protein 2